MIVWAIETLVATTLLMVVVLALRTPVRRSFGPNAAYALWAIPVVRMVLPPLPAQWRGEALPVMPAAEDITVYLGEPVATFAAEPVHGLGWPAMLLVLWIAGALAFAAYHLIAHGRFCARVRRLASRTDIVAAGNVRVIETDAATGPLAFGVMRKFVAFPRDFAERYDPLERDLALAHELGHHARGDLIANWVALAMLALHWFNPVAWRAFRAFRADQEMACDALVLAGRARELRAAYGRAIVKSAHGGAVSAACHLHTINEIKGRLKMLTRHEKTSRRRRMAGSAATAALFLGGLGLTASGTHATETVRTSVETVTGVDLASIELPQLPQLPEPPPPPASPLPVAPPAPPAPVLPEAPAGKKTTRIIVHSRDGNVRTITADGDVDETLADGSRVVFGSTRAGPDVRHIIVRSRDGKPLVIDRKPGEMTPEWRERLERMRVDMRNLPRLVSRDCGEGEGKAGEHVIRRGDGDRKVTIICTNRLERLASISAAAASQAGAQAFMIERQARGSALDSLRAARRSIEIDRNMSDAQRSAALAGIETALREVESDKD